MENFNGTTIATVDFIFYSTIFFFGMLIFLSRKRPGMGKLYYLWNLLALVAWGNAVISPRPLATRIFASLLLLSGIILQLMLARKDRLNQSASR